MSHENSPSAPEAGEAAAELSRRVPKRVEGRYVVCVLCANKEAAADCVHCNGTGLRKLPDFPMVR